MAMLVITRGYIYTSPAVSVADSNCQVRGEIKKYTADVLEHLSESVSNIDELLGFKSDLGERKGSERCLLPWWVSSFH